MKFRLSEGMAVIVRGRLSLYEQRGEYQLISEYLEPLGAGALQLAFMQLKERLAGEGLFDEARKRVLPLFPQRVGVITSSTGAAVHDILNVLGRRFASLEIQIYPVRVQGDGAANEIATAIAEMNRLNEVDLLIVGRGGGSLEDLQAFNEEIVARAVYCSRIPVISAVGHETDWTITDFVADLRAPTPSAAAELVSAAASDLRERVDALAHRLRQSVSLYLQLTSQRLAGLNRALHDPAIMLGHMQQRADDLAGRLDMAMRNLLLHRLEQHLNLEQRLSACNPTVSIIRLKQRILLLNEQAEHRITSLVDRMQRNSGQLSARLDTLSPLKTLSRGYAVAERLSDGVVLRDPSLLTKGELLRLRLQHGDAICRVESARAQADA